METKKYVTISTELLKQWVELLSNAQGLVVKKQIKQFIKQLEKQDG